MIYEVVYCADCKKPLKSVPSWMAGVNVRFSCDSCRQRHPRPTIGYDAPVVATADDDTVAADPTEAMDDEPIEAELDPEEAVVEAEE